MGNVPEALRDVLYTYCNVEAPEMTAALRRGIETGNVPAARVEKIRAELLDAINGIGLTPDDYKEITLDNECTNNDLLKQRLIEIWEELFQASGKPLSFTVEAEKN